MSLKIIFLFIFSLIFIIQPVAFAGGESSGGANGIVCDEFSQPVLLDFTLYNNKYAEVFKFADLNQFGFNFKDSLFAQTVGYDRIPLEQLKRSASFQLALKRLEIWKSKGSGSPIITNLISQALEGMDWIYTPFLQEPPVDPQTQSEVNHYDFKCTHPKIISIVVYDVQFGARISSPIWRKLGI